MRLPDANDHGKAISGSANYSRQC